MRRSLLVLVLVSAAGWWAAPCPGGWARAAPESTAATAGAAGWSWPLAPPVAVLRGFEAPPHRFAAGHRGADLGVRPGQQVRSAGAGVVSFAGLVAGRGVVTVSHGAVRTTYEPVRTSVRPGQRVARGDIVGVVAGSHAGCAPRSCLHWGLLRGDQYLDPLLLLGPPRVRLLPPLGRGLRPGPGTRTPSSAGRRQAPLPGPPPRPAPEGGEGSGTPSRLVPLAAAMGAAGAGAGLVAARRPRRR